MREAMNIIIYLVVIDEPSVKRQKDIFSIILCSHNWTENQI